MAGQAVKVPFQLHRRPESEPASAVLLCTHATDALLALCARLGGEARQIHVVADGFLVQIARPTRQPVAGVVRLRALADNLFLPVDADLTPALLDEEAADLVRTRGLVFLPGGRVLAFAADRPLSLAGLLEAPGLRPGSWQRLPEGGRLAEEIEEIVLDLPGRSPDEVIAEGQGEIGTEAPRPADSGPVRKAAGRASYGLGRALSWLGTTLGMQRLAAAGARLMEGALHLAPRLSEALLGRQEASLRELLREFLEGDVERALRRALPIGPDAPRGAAPAQGNHLPEHDVRYSLGGILGGQPGSVWFGGRADTYRQLEREYRKQAERATRRGDYRRAAFIYGRLLGDYRAAAAALARGSLHHDAAVVYEKKVNDKMAAAAEYEAAGEIDLALELYRQSGKHALAGDLLRRAGDEERAVAEYELAARRLVEGGNHHAAGELLLTRARRPDLALPYFAAGWSARPHGGFAACAVRLLRLHADTGAAAAFSAVVGEAEAFYSSSGNDLLAAGFFNEVARLADRPALAAVREDLRDRALLQLAGKLRQRAERGAGAVQFLPAALPPDAVWEPAVVSDARFAVEAAARVPIPSRSPARIGLTHLGRRKSPLRAVCQAPERGTLLIGFESGAVVAYDLASGDVRIVTEEGAAVRSLAVSADGNTLVVLTQARPTEAVLTSFARRASVFDYDRLGCQVVSTSGPAWLSPLIGRDLDWEAQDIAAVWDGEDLSFRAVPSLLALHRAGPRISRYEPHAALLLPSGPEPRPGLAVVTLGRNSIGYLPRYSSDQDYRMNQVYWSPRLPPGTTLSQAPLSWLRRGSEGLELAGVGATGQACWSRLEFTAGKVDRVTTATWESSEPCRAVAVVRAGLLAAVTPREVHWLRRGPRGLERVGGTRLSVPHPVAGFPSHRDGELLVLRGDGTLLRMPQPRG